MLVSDEWNISRIDTAYRAETVDVRFDVRLRGGTIGF
jgi:hypothetical protein